jgi:hypothetical protein
MRTINYLFALLFLLPLACRTQPKESWISKPSTEWPTIVLVNHFTFGQDDTYSSSTAFNYATTGFLINNGTDTFAATAKFVIWPARHRKYNTQQFLYGLQQWNMQPAGNLRDSAIMEKLLNTEEPEAESGWLLFTVRSQSPQLYPLKPRFTPLKEGEKVYLLGGPSGKGTTTVQEGEVFKREGDGILIQRDKVANKGGYNGAPVIDTNGYLVAIIPSGNGNSATGDSLTAAISVESLQDVLSKKINH